MSWRDQVKNAKAQSGRRNDLQAGQYPGLYLNSLTPRQSRDGKTYFIAEVTVLESLPLGQTRYAKTEGGEEFVDLHPQTVGESANIPFFVERFDAQRAAFKSFLSHVSGVDLDNASAEDVARVFDGAESNENPFMGQLITCDATPIYTKGNRRLITKFHFGRLPEAAQKQSAKLLKQALAARKSAA